MCNDYRLEVDIASIVEDFENLKIKIKLPEGTPNVPAREANWSTGAGAGRHRTASRSTTSGRKAAPSIRIAA